MKVFQGVPYIVLNLTQDCHSYMCLYVFHKALYVCTHTCAHTQKYIYSVYHGSDICCSFVIQNNGVWGG